MEQTQRKPSLMSIISKSFCLFRALLTNNPLRLMTDFWRKSRSKYVGHTRIMPCKELAFPFKQFDVDYTNSELGIVHKELAGIYCFQGVFLHTGTGVLISRSAREIRSTVIRESNVDDIDALIVKSPQYSKIRNFDFDCCKEIYYDRPVFVFEILSRKSNYFHFTIDNLMRLLTFLEEVECPCIVLHNPGTPGYVNDLFVTLSELYDVEFQQYPSDGFVKIESDVYVMDYVQKPWFQDFRSALSNNMKRFQVEADALKGDKSFRPIYRLAPMPAFWEASDGRRFKNDDVKLLPSRTGAKSVEAFLKKLRKKSQPVQEPFRIVCIDRRGETSRGRQLSNVAELEKVFPQIEFVKFGELKIEEQIRLVMETQILIGVHGAGLANAIYMSRGTKIINLMPEGFYLPRSNLMAAHCGVHDVEYKEVLARPLDPKFLELRVEPSDLEPLLS